METDSDFDSSQISATPPRKPSNPNYSRLPATLPSQKARGADLGVLAGSASRSEIENGECDAGPAEIGARPDLDGGRVGAVRMHPNSISVGKCVVAAPVKRLKCVNEGDFVRLNINGYNRKFLRKGGGRNCSSSASSRKLHWRKKGKGRLENEKETEMGSGFGDDEDDPSNENLKNLRKLAHGYDSFRKGQLEVIKQVLAGQSTMQQANLCVISLEILSHVESSEA
ncbi:hypothetical protein AAC387_Pa06g1910 [Persea americana]